MATTWVRHPRRVGWLLPHAADSPTLSVQPGRAAWLQLMGTEAQSRVPGTVVDGEQRSWVWIDRLIALLVPLMGVSVSRGTLTQLRCLWGLLLESVERRLHL